MVGTHIIALSRKGLLIRVQACVIYWVSLGIFFFLIPFFVINYKNNSFENSVFINNTLNLNLSASAGGEYIISVNSTLYNKSLVRVGSLRSVFIKWYFDVNVTNETGQAISDVEVSAFLSNGSLDYRNTTGSNGVARLVLSEYYRTNNVNYILTPHTIRVRKAGYTQNSTELSIRNTTYLLVNLSISKPVCGDTLYADFVLGSNLSCLGDGFTFGKTGLVFDGNGNSITGMLNGSG